MSCALDLLCGGQCEGCPRDTRRDGAGGLNPHTCQWHVPRSALRGMWRVPLAEAIIQMERDTAEFARQTGCPAAEIVDEVNRLMAAWDETHPRGCLDTSEDED